MEFRYTGIVVRDVPGSAAFYLKAFGFCLRYMHPSNGYAELESGATLLCFLGESFIEGTKLFGTVTARPNRPDLEPIAALVAFVTDDMDRDWARAVAAGASVVKEPEGKPWGQTAGYLRDVNGLLVEPCTRSPRDGAG